MLPGNNFLTPAYPWRQACWGKANATLGRVASRLLSTGLENHLEEKGGKGNGDADL
jgi:hypothetical protein